MDGPARTSRILMGLLLLSLFLVAAVPARPAPSILIVPGKSIGPVRLGMSMAQVVAAMERTYDESRALPAVREQPVVFTWKLPAFRSTTASAPSPHLTRLDVQIWRQPPTGVKLIMTNAIGFATREGVGPGSLLEAVVKSYGAPDKRQDVGATAFVYYYRLGMWVSAFQGVVELVTVAEPKSTR